MVRKFLDVTSISLTPSKDGTIRRCIRVLAMVHELHKAGYQQIRIAPFIHEIGTWRCPVTFARNLRTDVDDHRMIIDYDQAPQYTSASAFDGSYFDWQDSKGLSARELAIKFIKYFPRIAELGKGQDWEYAGWFTSILGYAEATGSLPIIIGNECSTGKCFLVTRPPTCIYGKKSIVREQNADESEDVSHWSSDPYWTRALNNYYELRDSGQTIIKIDLQALQEDIYNSESPAYRMIDAMCSVKNYEGWDGYRGAPRLVLALLAQLSEGYSPKSDA